MAGVPAAQRARLAAKLTGYVYPFLRRAPRDHPQARVVSMIALALRRDAYRK